MTPVLVASELDRKSEALPECKGDPNGSSIEDFMAPEEDALHPPNSSEKADQCDATGHHLL